jgi:hypothetical protein
MVADFLCRKTLLSSAFSQVRAGISTQSDGNFGLAKPNYAEPRSEGDHWRAHIVFSPDAARVRTAFADALNPPSGDAGGGWLIFALPPAELAVHLPGGAECAIYQPPAPIATPSLTRRIHMPLSGVSYPRCGPAGPWAGVAGHDRFPGRGQVQDEGAAPLVQPQGGVGQGGCGGTCPAGCCSNARRHS